MASWLPSWSTTALLRRTMNTGWPRQTTFSIWPSSSFDASTATGAPSALARALGLPRSDERNRGESNAHRAGADGGRRQQAAPAVVNLAHSFNLPTQFVADAA